MSTYQEDIKALEGVIDGIGRVTVSYVDEMS